MTIYSLVILPISGEFLMLPVRRVGERATPACTLSTVVHPVLDSADVASIEVPRFRWLEGIWPF